MDNISDQPSSTKILKNLKVRVERSTGEKRRRKKVIELIKRYKKLHQVLDKLKSMEIDYDQDSDKKIEKIGRRIQKISARRLSIHNFLVKNHILIDDNDQVVESREKPKLFITTTGDEDLNEKLTEFVNSDDDGTKIFGFSMPFRHVGVDEVRVFMDEINKQRGTQVFSTEEMVENVACEVNRQIKLFIEENHRDRISEWISSFDGKSNNSDPNNLEKSNCEPPSSKMPSWDDARMELCSARERGDINSEENEETAESTDKGNSIEEGETEEEADSVEGGDDDSEEEDGQDEDEAEVEQKMEEEVEEKEKAEEKLEVITLDSDDDCILIE